MPRKTSRFSFQLFNKHLEKFTADLRRFYSISEWALFKTALFLSFLYTLYEIFRHMK